MHLLLLFMRIGVNEKGLPQCLNTVSIFFPWMLLLILKASSVFKVMSGTCSVILCSVFNSDSSFFSSSLNVFVLILEVMLTL